MNLSIVYFDICSIPLFLLILLICYSRKMYKGTANKLFIVVVLLSLFSAVSDLTMELINNVAKSGVELTELQRVVCSVSTYVYLTLRNATNVALLLFLLALTRTTFLLKKTAAKIAFFAPYAAILVMLAITPFTGAAFTVTRSAGYVRGPLMYVFYGIALVYGLVGLAYCIYCRRYLTLNKWAALLSIYVLAHIAVFVQFFYSYLLLEMFFTAVGLMIVMLSIMRPEERMDTEVGILSWASYQSDLKNIILSGEHVIIIVIRMAGSRELRNFMGDHQYNKYLSVIADGLRSVSWKRQDRIELYFERPGNIYIIADASETNCENVGEHLKEATGEKLKEYADMGVRFEPEVCVIRCPEDLSTENDIIGLGHRFRVDGDCKQTALAADIVNTPTFTVESRIEEILERAIRNNYIEMYYQPIYNVRSGSFRSAEALARIIDPEFGVISPAIFIPAAETLGFIIPIGDAVLESVFRFVSEHDLDALGLDYIELNLSVAQCMERSLPDKILAVQQKYGVDPSRINLEITETTFGNISDVMIENVKKLIDLGYTFALDDYGIGYSSIQRVNRIPLCLIKVDKSLLDETFSTNGRKILEHTVRMMQSIGKRIVAEGAETADVVDFLKSINCDYIQGYYFSKPLPPADFIDYLKAHNGRAGE